MEYNILLNKIFANIQIDKIEKKRILIKREESIKGYIYHTVLYIHEISLEQKYIFVFMASFISSKENDVDKKEPKKRDIKELGSVALVLKGKFPDYHSFGFIPGAYREMILDRKRIINYRGKVSKENTFNNPFENEIIDSTIKIINDSKSQNDFYKGEELVYEHKMQLLVVVLIIVVILTMFLFVIGVCIYKEIRRKNYSSKKIMK